MTDNNNDFISSLKSMNEDNIIHHIKNIKHTPIEIIILKKRLVEIRNRKQALLKEKVLENKIKQLDQTIKKQQEQLHNQYLAFQLHLLKEQNKKLIEEKQNFSKYINKEKHNSNFSNNDFSLGPNDRLFNQANTLNSKFSIDRPISTMTFNKNDFVESNRFDCSQTPLPSKVPIPIGTNIASYEFQNNMSKYGNINETTNEITQNENPNMKMGFVGLPIMTRVPKGNDNELQHPSSVKIIHDISDDHPSMISRKNFISNKKINGENFNEFQKKRNKDLEEIYNSKVLPTNEEKIGPTQFSPIHGRNTIKHNKEDDENSSDNIDYIKELLKKKKKAQMKYMIKKNHSII